MTATCNWLPSLLHFAISVNCAVFNLKTFFSCFFVNLVQLLLTKQSPHSNVEHFDELKKNSLSLTKLIRSAQCHKEMRTNVIWLQPIRVLHLVTSACLFFILAFFFRFIFLVIYSEKLALTFFSVFSFLSLLLWDRKCSFCIEKTRKTVYFNVYWNLQICNKSTWQLIRKAQSLSKINYISLPTKSSFHHFLL